MFNKTKPRVISVVDSENKVTTLHFANYNEYKQWWKENYSGLSKEEQDKRRPISPELLIGALTEPIHKKIDKSKTTKVIK